MPPVSLLIKPVSGSCNLRCRYCFYIDEAQNRETACFGRMSDSTLENLIREALSYAEHSCTFAFQGGEPTLAGIDFYRRVCELQSKYNVNGLRINNSIQTNGTLLNEEWARFLHDNHFLVGLSLDGYRGVHDMMRVDARGEGTFKQVYAASKLLDQHHVDYNILCVVNRYVAQNAEQVYSFFRRAGYQYIQPIACLDPIGVEPGSLPHSLTARDYAHFLKTFFRLWAQDLAAGRMVVIRTFDNYLGMMLGYRPEVCSMMGQCICQNVVEADGSVYPCDFYVLDEWRMGNVNEMRFAQLQNSPQARRFTQLSRHVDPECAQCEWRELCRGGCRRDRDALEDGRPGKNRYCEAYKAFFAYAYPTLREIVSHMKPRPAERDVL